MHEHDHDSTSPKDADRVLAALGEHGFDLALDLCGLSDEEARDKLEQVLGEPQRGLRVAVKLDPPAGNGAESLFQPVGRRLLEAMRARIVQDCRPFSPEEHGIGFVFTFA